jgi:stress-induced-phosphoprotein 1
MSNIMMEMQAQRAGETDEQTYERAMRDPEVAEIMGDPIMRRELELFHTLEYSLTGAEILADSQQDPRALMDHMKNPSVSACFWVVICSEADRQIAAKIQKLINAGIIKTR